jgi:hypothetical protein
MTRRLAAVVLLLAGACTNADVYSATGGMPLRPDRIAITGRVCTEDTTGARFPLKGLIMFDGTGVMAAADPGSYRFCGGAGCSPGSLRALIDRLHNQRNAWLGFAKVGSVSVAVAPKAPALCTPSPCDPQQYYPARDVDSGIVEAALGGSPTGLRDVGNAISLAQSFITADMAQAKAGELLRTRYVVFMLFAGPPQGLPAPSAADLAAEVADLKAFAYARGVLEFRLNIGFLSAGVLTGDLTAAERQAGIEAYSAMAFAGDGVFREFETPPNIDIQLDAASTNIRLKRKDIAVYNLNERLGGEGPEVDSDGDGLSDSEELAAVPPTNPYLWDTDGDGLSDRLEFRAYPRQNPTDKNDRPAACLDPDVYDIRDSDLDLLNDCEEGLLQTSASIPDSDGDGLPDALEFMSGTVPTSADDRLLDFDGDGIANAQEVLEHTNPRANEGQLRGAERYANEITDLGWREVANMEDREELRAVSFRSAGPGVKGGAALLEWTPATRTLEWSDARWQAPGGLKFVPVAVTIDESGVYTLCAQNAATGEQVCIEVSVVVEWLPTVDTLIYPLISISDRNCYDVRFSNIKLVQTAPAVDVLHPNRDGSGNLITHEEGVNHILIFFTQAPENRLDAPGIARIAEIPVRFLCGDPTKPETCARNPAGGFVTLDDSQFAASVQ